MADAMQLGERIRARRLELGLTQADLAGENLSLGYISLVESGKREPSDRALNLILEALQISRDELLSDGVALFDARDLALQKQIDLALERTDVSSARDLWNRMSPHLQGVLAGRSQLAQILELEDRWKELLPLSQDNLFAAIRESRWTLAATNLRLFTRTSTRLGLYRSTQRVLLDAAQALSHIEYVDILFDTQLRIQLANHAMDEGDGIYAQLELENALRNLPDDVDSEVRMSVLWALSTALFSVGNHSAALEAAEAARNLVDRETHHFQYAALLSAVVELILRTETVDPLLVAKVAKDVAALHSAVQQQPITFTNYMIEHLAAEFAFYKKDYDEYHKIMSKFADDFPEDVAWRADRKVRLAEISLIQHRPDDALTLIREGLMLLESVEWNYGLKDTLIRISKVFAALGKFEEAHRISLKVAEFRPAVS